MMAQPVEEQIILLASDGQADDMFGNAMAISGNFAVIGTPQDDDVDSNSGAAYIYEKIGGNWIFSEKLVVDDGELADMFGISVDIDGDYLIVGAWQAVGLTGNTGAAYIYKRNGSNWDFQQKIYANDGESADNFGKTVAISGEHIVVGAPNEYFGSGVAYIFHKNGEDWTQVIRYDAEDTSGTDHFGCSVDIDGNYIVVGAWQNDAPGSNTGAAYVYYNNVGIWGFQSKLIADDAQVDDGLGYSVSISGDYVVAGAHAVNGAQGAAYVFERDNTTWTQDVKLTASNGGYEDYFGKAVSISGDYIMIGAHRHSVGKGNEGSAYFFIGNGTSWNEESEFTASDAGDTGLFGYNVAIEGDYAFVSSVQNNGAVYVFAPVGADIKTITGNIILYPNPTNDIVYLSDIENVISVVITDIKGKVIINKKLSGNNTINISQLESGIYIVNVKTTTGIFTSKIVKK